MLLEYCNQPFTCITCCKYRETCVEIHVRKLRMEKSRNQGNIGHKTRNDKKNTQKTKKVSTTDPTKYHKNMG